MRNTIFVLSFFTLLISCSEIINKELFNKTDFFVDSLQTTYESYGIISSKNSTTTSDGYYEIIPTGRLIILKISTYVDDVEYEELRKDLENHYKNDDRVNKVYINQVGTVVIDCRN